MFHPERILHSIYKGATWHEDTIDQEVFITFDDGPIPEITPWVLDQADKWNAKICFFCVGENVSKYPEIYNEVLKRGHQVGNHTYNHMQAWRNNRTDYFANIQKASELIDSPLFRPPHGQLYPWYIKTLKNDFQKIVMWNVLSRDYNQRLSGKTVFNNVKRSLKPGSIIVFHDSLKAARNMKYAFPKTMELLAQKNYKTGIIKTP